ncbi:hypothetical protein J2S43_003965 [Catenuloplanes nepalensis]|uniref:N-acetyltransferase domain-containing protein n=1 Tax=Catenuloplanes nepalensis TaxID=587533 RepID=A0ABT9MW50_9ACTN|nr:hypothetical protein [Catenuloplanes nepalensis]MDP9795453.1 hypothetical protein [Catenuloplanes nepalensis]
MRASGLDRADVFVTGTLHKRAHACRLVAEAAIRDGLASGATVAYLRSSAMGRPLYESMGFEKAEDWTYLHA